MIIYVAIRNVDGEEIPSRDSARGNYDEVRERIEQIRKHTPEWDAKYPVVRIARFHCKEI